MQASDIVNQLSVLLPLNTDKFTNELSITSLTRSGTTVTADTATPHKLAVNDAANIVGAQTPITISSLTRAGVIGTMVTAENHDFTPNFSTQAEIADAVEAEFNGTFTILTVPNRKTVTFTMADAGATVATGSPLLLNGQSALKQYNGIKQVTAISTPSQFQFEVAGSTLFTPATGTILARTKPRVSSTVSIEKIVDAYTKQAPDDLWAFVVLDDVAASKSRHIESDATDNIQRGDYYRQQTIQPFAVYVVIPSSQEIAGRIARDLAEEIFQPMCKSLLGSKFDSGLTVGKQNPVNFVSHGLAVSNSAYYIHAYNFEQTVDITFGDTIGYDLDVAFRDIQLSMGIDVGTGEDPLTANIDLDDTPI